MAENAKPIMAWNNKMESGTITSSTEASGFPDDNLKDWRTYTKWKGVQDKDDDISQTVGAGIGSFGELTSVKRTGQTFEVLKKSKITSVNFKLKTQGSPTDKVKCAVYSTTGSPELPDAEIVVSATEKTCTGDFVVYTFEFDYDLPPGDYAFVLYRSGDLSDTDYYLIQYETSNVYAAGHECRDHDGSGWAAYTGRDLYFEIQYDYPDQWIKIDAGSGETFTVDCLGLAGHDLKTQGITNLVLQWSDDDFSWTNCHTPFTPGSDKAIFKSFTEVTHRYFRLLIPPGTAAPQIGILFIGPYMQFPSWCSGRFDPDEQRKIFAVNRSRAGHLIGAVQRFRMHEIHADFNILSMSFVTDNIIPWYKDHVPKPFFWIWDETNHSDEVYLGAVPDKYSLKIPMGPNSRSFSLDIIGVAE